jgi:NAD(P)-dependent dehydrogenase (short-subunit alcohol dehydrogenase family)
MAKWTAANMPSQAGNIAIVTGANSGIGFQASLQLARSGAAVVLACRDPLKADDAKRRILAELPHAVVELGIVDMSSLASVRKFAAGFTERDVIVDILINNAGVMAVPQRTLTPDGYELQFATNHLGHFALTGLLLPSLMKNPKARVVTVSSVAHKRGKIEFDNLNGERSYKPWDAYSQSKLANLYFAFELERRFLKSRVRLSSIAVHPGVAATNIANAGPKLGAPDLKSFIVGMLMPFYGQPEAQGALPLLYGATSPDAIGGGYYGPDGSGEHRGFPTRVWPSTLAMDENIAKRLWTVSEDLTGVKYEERGLKPWVPMPAGAEEA